MSSQRFGPADLAVAAGAVLAAPASRRGTLLEGFGAHLTIRDLFELHMETQLTEDEPFGLHLGTLSGRATNLRPFAGSDHDWAAQLLSSPVLFERGWLRGQTPAPGTWPEVLWAGVPVQMTVRSHWSETRLGIVRATNLDLRERHAYLDAVFDPSALATGWVLEGIGVFIDHLFGAWPLRKLYAEVSAPVWQRLGTAPARLLDIEGCLRGHRWVSGNREDVYVVSIHHSTWDQRRAGLIDWSRP